MLDIPHDIFNIIVSPKNIEGAYFDLVSKFDKESKSYRYRGVDGTKVSSIDFISAEMIDSIRLEMVAVKKIMPAYMTTIPKKDGKKRKIYVYSIKERIKAEAIYRVLQPLFNDFLSPHLFSYRSSHPSYYAARSAVRRYKRYYGKNHILVTDISDYAETIDHDILIHKLMDVGIDTKTLTLLEMYIKTDTFEEGKIIKRQKGVLTGTPLYALLSNFYMDEFDKWAGTYVSFYRRVGDDIIAMDKNMEKVANVNKRLLDTADKLKIKINSKKSKLIKDTDEFKFLGYSFKEGKIGFDQNSIEKTIAGWKKQIFSSRSRSNSRKAKHVAKLSTHGSNNLHNQFSQLIKQKILVDNDEQIKSLSERFFTLLTTFITGRYSSKNRRLTEQFLKRTEVPNLYTYYLKARYPKHHA
jgi:hypothetical protein